jgi:cell division protease FtsH
VKSKKELLLYHEAGHAIVGRLCPTHDPVYKVTIIPRGRALRSNNVFTRRRYLYAK